MSSSTNPRKFSEKIAILNRKAEEETHEINRVLNEVRNITRPAQPEGGLVLPNAGWPRPGGSLPNVHEMVQQPGMPGMPMQPVPYPWPQPMDESMNRTMHPHRNRSPGAHPPHFHPYRAGGGHISPGSSVRQSSPERIAQMGVCMPPGYYPGPDHPQQLLQPPDPAYWRRTVSDPTIHNSVMHRPGMAGSTGAGSSPPHTPTPPTPGGSPGDNSQGSPTVFITELEAIKGQNTGEFSRQTDPCETSLPSYHPPLTGSQSQPVSISPAVPGGSLPDFARPGGPGMFAFQPPSYGEAMSGPHSGIQQLVHQRHSIQLPVPPGIAVYGPPRMPNSSCTLAATPPYGSESQSAPNSPQTNSNSPPGPMLDDQTQYYAEQLQSQIENIRMVEGDPNQVAQSSQAQWYQQPCSYPGLSKDYQMYLQQYSNTRLATTTAVGNIPNIILTDSDGAPQSSVTMADPSEYIFNESILQNLDTTELQALLSNDIQVEPSSEDALRLDRN